MTLNWNLNLELSISNCSWGFEFVQHMVQTTITMKKHPKNFNHFFHLNKKILVLLSGFKVRFLAKGYKQKLGIDYFEVFALIARLDTFKMIISLPAHNSWKIFQMDVKYVFLNGTSEEEFYLEQPACF